MVRVLLARRIELIEEVAKTRLVGRLVELLLRGLGPLWTRLLRGSFSDSVQRLVGGFAVADGSSSEKRLRREVSPTRGLPLPRRRNSGNLSRLRFMTAEA
jgi:hypothetical protein